ncbi:MAG: flippase-like domain-containing protein [Deltaproteobacteria bacterium]|nr:flippase-like domain-containing protein [Deltaproteobacteria bacterium]
MRSTFRRGLLLVLLWGLAVLLGAAAVARLVGGRSAIPDLWARAQPGTLLLGVLLISVATVLVAVRWRWLLPEPARSRANLGLLTAIQCASTLFSYALPGPTGDLAAAVMVKRRYGIALSDALVAGLALRILGLGVAGAVAGVTWLALDVELPGLWRQAFAVAVVGMVGVAGGIALAALAPGPFRRTVAALARWIGRGALARPAARLAGASNAVLDALEATAARGARPLVASSLWTVVGHCISPIGLAVAARGLGIQADWVGVCFANNFTIVAAVALYVLPGAPVGWDVLYGAVMTRSAGIGVVDAAALVAVGRLQLTVLVVAGALSLLGMARWLLPAGKDDLSRMAADPADGPRP